jgi:hypothetical protein
MVKSKTLSDEPRLDTPYTLKLEPIRANERIESADPITVKSSRDMAEANLERPYMEIEDPSLAKLRIDKLDPM